jgi:hypothetical protein
MKIIITEEQQKMLITEGIGDELKRVYQETLSYSKGLYDRASSQLNMNLKFLLTWGAGIGGVARPLEDFLNEKHPDIGAENVTLIVISVLSILFYQNQKRIKELSEKIKENGLLDVYEEVLQKGLDLKKSFKKMLFGLGNLTHTSLDIMSYAYMIPLVGLLYGIYSGADMSPEELKLLIRRLKYIGIFTVSGIVLKDLLQRISRN